MKIRSCAVSFLSAATLLCLASARSAPAGTFGPYLKVDGGMNMTSDTDLSIAGNSGSLSLDMGYRVDAAVGYEFNRWVALEVEGGYAHNSVDKLTLGPLVNSLSSESSLTQIPLLVNVVLRYENQTDFVPYIGAGAGGVLTSLKISDEKDNDIVFAWQGKAGVIYKIDEQAWIDVSYKLLGTEGQDYRLGTVPLQTKRMYNHFIGLSVIWKF